MKCEMCNQQIDEVETGDAKVNEWRERVGVELEHRRIRFGYISRRSAAKAAGISEASWRQLESGKRQLPDGSILPPNPTLRTRMAVTELLLWPENIFDSFLKGKA